MVNADTIHNAVTNLANGTVGFVLVSGKMAAGKDTIAPLLLQRAGYSNCTQVVYADALKDELDNVFAVLRSSLDKGTACVEVAEKFSIPTNQATDLVELVWDEVRGDDTVHSRSRTPSVRRALQMLGTDIRRTADPDYWVNIALANSISKLAEGYSVYVTDARFPNEVELARQLGAFCVRLQVSEATQQERIWVRDGMRADPDALSHPSETALDDFFGFTCVIDNNGTVDEAVSAIMKLYRP